LHTLILVLDILDNRQEGRSSVTAQAVARELNIQGGLLLSIKGRNGLLGVQALEAPLWNHRNMVCTLSASAHSALILKATQLVLSSACMQARVKRMRYGTRCRRRRTWRR